MRITNFIFGNPLKTDSLSSERLTKVRALAVFASDVLSSVTYATEEILLALSVALAYKFSLSIALIIILLLSVVTFSYWQTLQAYPQGGGAFVVARKNLGEFCSLIAAAALLIDYTLTVAVSLSAGANAIISAFPHLSGYRVSFCLIALLFIMIMNLRGSKESASLLSFPTYGFILISLIMITTGIIFKNDAHVTISHIDNPADSLLIVVLLRAFAAGCCALTGIEAIAGGVTAFKKPQYRNAQITLLTMAVILSTLFFGITYLADKFAIFPNDSETVISQIAKTIFGDGILYYFTQFMTVCILFLAANTSFAAFPRLASILAQRKYIPTSFANLGDRLAFSNGIIALALAAMILIFSFNGDTHSLMPLYAIGVFTSFTLSQSGMVLHWLSNRGKNWQLKVIINALGAFATCIALIVIIESKFVQGAWIVIVLVPIFVSGFIKIKQNYRIANNELDIRRGGIGYLLRPIKTLQPKVIVPVSRIHKGTLAALRFASSLSNDVVAVIVNVNLKETERIKLTWRSLNFDIPLVILSSPYRSIINPFLDFLFEQDNREPERGDAIIVMPSFVTSKFWHNILHKQTATIFKTALLYKKQSSERTRIIVEIPYQMNLSPDVIDKFGKL